MSNYFPFYSSIPEKDGRHIYHTHPRCRIAQHISAACRVAGTGEGRQQCPFCFLFGQFEMNKSLRGPLTSTRGPGPGRETGAASAPL